uniref:UPAR/Ly6 domain-containing protein n=1 Tax=Poecilia formosa TaxID=48698 RepID=A0A096M2V8_POEFO
MFLFSLVLGLLFLPEADTLKCECESRTYESCSEKTTECSSQNDRCSAAISVMFEDGTKVYEVNFKGCAMHEVCVDYSFSYGAYRFVEKITCCNGDLCNTEVPDYKLTPNGKKCFTCEKENCMKTLNCEGNENYCFTATKCVENQTLKGCASKLICSYQLNPFPGANFSCCQGDYCNSASSASPALLLLLVPLLISTLFS